MPQRRNDRRLGVEGESRMTNNLYTILSGFLFGIGFHLGWGIVALIISMLASAVGHDAGFLR